MSTKTTFKRIALVAVASLGFGVLTSIAPAIAGATTATSVSVSPVRYSAGDTVPAATLSFTTVGALLDASTGGVLTVTQAPTGTAAITVDDCGGAAGTAMVDDLATAAGAATVAEGAALAGNIGATTAATCAISISANAAAGTYKGTLVLTDSAGSTDALTISWSFTTAGKVASITTDVTAVNLPAVAVSGGNTDVVFKNVKITLKDSAGATTQAASGDSLSVAITGSATNITLKTASGQAEAASLSVVTADIADGTHTFTVASETAVADSETVTITPAGIMPAQGVAAATLTATTTGYGVETGLKTVLASPTVASVVAAGAANGLSSSYKVDPSNTSYAFDVSGYTAGAAYKVQVKWTDASGAGGTATVKDDTSNTTAASLTSGTASNLYGIVGSTGVVRITVVATAGNANLDTIEINPENATAGDYNDAADSLVTNADSAYAATITTPAVTPSMVTTGTAIAVAGKIADQYGNPLSGASVAVTGTVTTTDTTPANLTGTATSAADGTWSLTLSAATALTTIVSIVAAATKTGASISSSTPATVVNLTASGSPASMTWTDGLASDEDSFTVLAPLSKYPATVVPYTGSVTGDTDEIYTISTGLTDGTLNAEDGCVALTATTTPGSQVVFTGTAGVKFTKTSCGTAQSVAKLLDTVTVASGTAAYAVATKTGANTVTMTSGTVSKTATFYAYNALTSASAGDAIRNLSVDKAAMSLNAGQIGFLTITATDAFGNLVKSAKAAAGAVVTVKASGQALLDGPALSRDYTTTDSAGQIVVGVIAGATAGTSTVAITSTGAQLGAAAGSATSTTAGTNGLTASVSTASSVVTIVGNTTDAVTTAAASTDAKIAALQAALEALAAKSIADKAATDAAIAAAQAAAVAAAEAAADAAAEAIDAGNNAFDAATSAGEAADAATAAAEQAGEDATAAATAAGEAAVAAAEAAQEAAAEATDAANAATDAANASAEAADAATAAAQDAADAVAALSTQVSEMVSALKKQITALTNLVIKIQKKVKA
jgi:trimeric autotransporter adhesin